MQRFQQTGSDALTMHARPEEYKISTGSKIADTAADIVGF